MRRYSHFLGLASVAGLCFATDVTSQFVGGAGGSSDAATSQTNVATDPNNTSGQTTGQAATQTGAANAAIPDAATGTVDNTGNAGSQGGAAAANGTGAVSLVSELKTDETNITDHGARLTALESKVGELVSAQNAAASAGGNDMEARFKRLCKAIYGDENAF